MKQALLNIDKWKAEKSDLFGEAPNLESGSDWCFRHSQLIDRVFESIVDAAGAKELVSLTATGGYGRMELAPYSDLDITLIPIDEANPDTDTAVRHVFDLAQQALADALHYRIGYALRFVHDAHGLDAKTRTGLLDARHVAGNPKAFQNFMEVFRDSFPLGDFLVAKVAERKRQLLETNDTPLVLEPNLKLGAGGLRDFHFASWIATSIGETAPAAPKGFDRLLAIRNMLHSAAGSSYDRLTVTKRIDIAERLQIDPDEFGSQVAKALLTMDQYRQSGLNMIARGAFPIYEGLAASDGRLTISSPSTLCGAAYAVNLGVQLNLEIGRLEPEMGLGFGPTFLAALEGGERTIRALDSAGLLKSILPELDVCRTLFPGDTVHRFTVFEHTLRVSGALEDRSTPFLSDLWTLVGHTGPLHLAALLHDVGKADRTGPHSETGARIAAEVCRRLGLSASESDLVVWLVREHLRMDRSVRFRDVQHPETITEFANAVQTPERLACLTLLTIADVKSVAPDIWTPAYEALLRELFARTLDYMDSTPGWSADPALLRRKLLRELKSVADPEAMEEFLHSMPASYVISTPPELARLHLDYYRRALEGGTSIEFDHSPELGTSEMTVCARDRSGLLSQILGVLYALDLSISGLRAATSHSKIPIALDSFTISFGGHPIPPATTQRLASIIKSIVSGEMSADQVLREHGKDPERRQEHRSYTFLEGSPAILEVRAPRGRGMAYRVARMLADAGLSVVSARVGQWAGNGVAAFYIVDPSGQPITKSAIDKLMD